MVMTTFGPRVFGFEVPDGFGHVVERIGPVDHRGEAVGLGVGAERVKVLPAGCRGEK